MLRMIVSLPALLLTTGAKADCDAADLIAIISTVEPVGKMPMARRFVSTLNRSDFPGGSIS
jgi:hypothetical protein